MLDEKYQSLIQQENKKANEECNQRVGFDDELKAHYHIWRGDISEDG